MIRFRVRLPEFGRRAAWMLPVTGVVLAPLTAAHAAMIFGPKEYVVQASLPWPALERFPACQPEKGGQLRVENGPNGRAPATMAVLVFNRRETVVMLEQAGQPRLVERAVQLAPSNTLFVWWIGPRGATLVVSVTSAGACLEVAITSPPSGATVPEGLLQVHGTVDGPPDLGVAVNGVPAAVSRGAFVALVPVTPGATELTATATTVGGLTAEARQSITVVEAPETTVRLLPSPSGGLAPLTVGFGLSSLVGTATVKLDLEGDGSVDFEGPRLDGQEFTYAQPGVYVPSVQVTDLDGQIHSATTLIEVYDRSALDRRLQLVWADFKDAVRQGNVARAVSFLHSETRDAYAEQLGLLRPQTLARIDTYLTAIELVEVGPGGAEYEMLRDRDGVTLSFAVWFRVDHDGIWRLFRF